jgi:hypothetical protein
LCQNPEVFFRPSSFSFIVAHDVIVSPRSALHIGDNPKQAISDFRRKFHFRPELTGISIIHWLPEPGFSLN